MLLILGGSLVLIATALVIVTIPLCDTISPVDLTRTRIGGIAYQLGEYLRVHKRLPAELSDLPSRVGYDNSLKDAWGNKVLWDVSGRIITLRSLGRDGKPGGKGEDSDHVLLFEPERTDTYRFAWQEEFLPLSGPGEDVTRSRMIGIAAMLHEYVRVNGKVPNTLSDLPEHEAYDSNLVDAWGNEIVWSEYERIVTLISSGKDGKPGGEGKDCDIVEAVDLRGLSE